MRYTSIDGNGRKELFLTRLCDNGNWEVSQGVFGYSVTGEAVNKFADYEDAEEQGRLIKLPCKEGDTIYHIGSKYTDCTICGRPADNCPGCFRECDSKEIHYIYEGKARIGWMISYKEFFNERWFITREAADQRLAEIKRKVEEYDSEYGAM
jgi:hypothetical protein